MSSNKRQYHGTDGALRRPDPGQPRIDIIKLDRSERTKGVEAAEGLRTPGRWRDIQRPIERGASWIASALWRFQIRRRNNMAADNTHADEIGGQ
jgi:hypothetical protein